MTIGENSHCDAAQDGTICAGCGRALETGEPVFLDEDNSASYCEVVQVFTGTGKSCAGQARDAYIREHNPVLIG